MKAITILGEKVGLVYSNTEGGWRCCALCAVLTRLEQFVERLFDSPKRVRLPVARLDIAFARVDVHVARLSCRNPLFLCLLHTSPLKRDFHESYCQSCPKNAIIKANPNL